MKVQTIEGIECPECSAFIPEDNTPQLEERYQCGECEEVYEDRDKAEECCRD